MKFFFISLFILFFIEGCGEDKINYLIDSSDSTDVCTKKPLYFFAWDGIVNYNTMVDRTPQYCSYVLYLNPLENGINNFVDNAQIVQKKGGDVWYLLSATTTYPSDSYIDDAINIILNYNETHTKKVLGISYDIEPWIAVTEQNSSDNQAMWEEYLDFVEAQYSKLHTKGLKLSMVIPSWLDTISEAYPYGRPINYEIIDRTDEVVVMDYTRNESIFVSAIDSTLSYAQEHNGSVIVALEMVENQNTQISFYDDPESIKTFLSLDLNNSSFDGYAIHTLDAFVESGIFLEDD